jgi:hypothetical protein
MIRLQNTHSITIFPILWLILAGILLLILRPEFMEMYSPIPMTAAGALLVTAPPH